MLKRYRYDKKDGRSPFYYFSDEAQSLISSIISDPDIKLNGRYRFIDYYDKMKQVFEMPKGGFTIRRVRAGCIHVTQDEIYLNEVGRDKKKFWGDPTFENLKKAIDLLFKIKQKPKRKKAETKNRKVRFYPFYQGRNICHLKPGTIKITTPSRIEVKKMVNLSNLRISSGLFDPKSKPYFLVDLWYVNNIRQIIFNLEDKTYSPYYFNIAEHEGSARVSPISGKLIQDDLKLILLVCETYLDDHN